MRQYKQIIVLLLSFFLLSLLPPPSSAQGQTKLVLAFYYAWFDPSSFGPSKTPFQPISPYFSASAATIDQHVAQAKSAGIDGLVQSWYGPNAGQQTEPNFQMLLNSANQYGMKAAVDFEAGSPFYSSHQDRIDALNTLINGHANHPAYLRVDNKPVIFFWANWLYTMDDWAYIRQQTDPNHNTIWIADGVSTEYLSVFDGLHLYNTAWSNYPASTAASWKSKTKAAAQTHGRFKYWVATAMPGFNDRLLGRGDDSLLRPRSNGDYYKSSFSGAASSQPDMLIITSFNEWPEGSNIEPSVEFGNLYLDLTKQLIADYKAGVIQPYEPPPTRPWSSPTPFATPTFGPSPTPTNTPTATSTSTPIFTPTPSENGYIIYTVQPGDTLFTIGQRYNVPLIDLYTYNNINNQTVLFVGQKITLGLSSSVAFNPFVPGHPQARMAEDGTIYHEVLSGQTMIGIANEYKLSLEQLFTLNNISNQSFISVGQKIVVGSQLRPQTIGGSSSNQLPTNTPFPPTLSPDTPTPTTTVTPIFLPTVTPTSKPIIATPTETPTATNEESTISRSSGLLLLGIVLLLGFAIWLRTVSNNAPKN